MKLDPKIVSGLVVNIVKGTLFSGPLISRSNCILAPSLLPIHPL
jgi:hypothetical protein